MIWQLRNERTNKHSRLCQLRLSFFSCSDGQKLRNHNNLSVIRYTVWAQLFLDIKFIVSFTNIRSIVFLVTRVSRSRRSSDWVVNEKMSWSVISVQIQERLERRFFWLVATRGFHLYALCMHIEPTLVIADTFGTSFCVRYSEIP